MKVKDLIKELDLVVLNDGDSEREVEGCYIGDLLSWVMSNAQANNVWLTIMSNLNIAAVATLTDVSCIILCENVLPDEDCLSKIKTQEINLFKTELSMYDIAVKIGKLI